MGSNSNESGLYSGGVSRDHGPGTDNPDQEFSLSISARLRNCSFQIRIWLLPFTFLKLISVSPEYSMLCSLVGSRNRDWAPIWKIGV